MIVVWNAWAFLGFHHDHYDGTFVGEIADPLLASFDGADLRLEPLAQSPSALPDRPH